MFWLATLNPGRKIKRRRAKGRRRKLYGAALWAHRAKRRGRRKGRLSKAQRRALKKMRAGWLAKFGKPMRKRRMSRRRRPRHSIGRNKMAYRVRRRSRRNVEDNARRPRRRRRSRRNAWPDDTRGHRKAAKLGWRRRRRGGRKSSRRRNPWVTFSIPRQTRTQWRLGRRGGFKFARRVKKNAVVPVSWNPRRPRRRRRSYYRNAVVPVSWNPRRRRRHYSDNPVGMLGDIFEGAQKFINVDFWTSKALPMVGGIVGTRMIGSTIYGLVGEKVLGVKSTDAAAPWVRIGADILATSALSFAVRRFLKQPGMADYVFLGGVASVALSVAKLLLGGTEIGKQLGLSGMGQDLSTYMRRAVADRVRARVGMNGTGEFVNVTALRPQLSGVGEFLNETALRAQPGFAPAPTADLRDYDVTRTETTF